MDKLSRISSLAVLLHVILLRPFVKLVSGINIIGKENLDGLEQYIIIANHNSHLDVLLLYYLMPINRIARSHPVADQPHFRKSPFVYRLVNFFFKPIWVTRGQSALRDDPLSEIKRAIEDGQNVFIFPEGTRGSPGEMQKFKSGIGRLMAQYPEIPIVPVFLTGPEKALPRASSLLLPLWANVIVGPAQECSGDHREITRHLENILTELSRSESARRHKRKPHETKLVKQIAFLGIDGSGKSTTSQLTASLMSEDLRIGLISDELKFFDAGQPSRMQPLLSERLRQVIGGYAKKAKSLKLYKIPKLAELFLRDHLFREAVRWYAPDLIVLDGSPLLNLLAWSSLYKKEKLNDSACSMALGILAGLITNVERDDSIFVRFPELRQMKRLGLTKMILPDVVIMIDIQPDEACRRIDSRGERVQVHENEEKLERLRNAYKQVCRVVESDWNVPTLILDGMQTREELRDAALAFIRRSLKMTGDLHE